MNGEQLTSITIPSSVTSIGSNAFNNCSSLTSITIPDSVTSIGSNAFNDCNSLTNITIPSVEWWLGINHSNTYLFLRSSGSLYMNGVKLTSITIPDSVTSIGDLAFWGCSSLTSITIPNSVTSIGRYAFCRCSSLTSIIIPDSVTSIESHVFNDCSGLTSITIPSGVTNIGDCEFYGCSSLTSITIPESVTSIGSSAFYGCSSLTNITIPDSVTSIGNRAFANCTSLISIYIPSNVETINASSSGYSPFYGCSSSLKIYTNAESKPSGWGDYWNYYETSSCITIWYGISRNEALFYGSLTGSETTVVIPDGVTIIPEKAFDNNKNLTSITISSGVTSIGSYAFHGCSSLTSITIPSLEWWFGMDHVYTGLHGSLYVNGAELTSVTIPDGVTCIGNYMFSGCSGLTCITIPDSVTSIGENAFSGCSSLTSITIPDSVTNIGENAFSGCSSLTSITIPDSMTIIGSNAFSGFSGLTSIVIPNSVTSIEKNAFYYCRNLTSITIPSSVTSIGDGVFEDCSSLTSITIPDSVTSIGGYAFYGCSSLTNITIPDSVTSIGDRAFANCTGLTSIYIPSSVVTINASSAYLCPFCDCSSSLKMYTNVASIPSGWGAYWNYTSSSHTCSTFYGVSRNEALFYGSLTGSEMTVVIPDGITLIPDDAFNSSSLTNITIPDSVKIIGYNAFSYCRNLENIYIPSSVVTIRSSASLGPFRGCSSLNIYTDANVSKWGSYWNYYDNSSACNTSYGLLKNEALFYGSLTGKETKIVIPDGFTLIPRNAFYNNWNLTSITIPESVTSIGQSAFSECSSLISILIPESVTSIGQSAFSGCRSLTGITIPDNVTSISSYAFSGCRSLTGITIPDNVTSISSYAFSGCSSLTDITIPDNVKSVGNYAFSRCSGLTGITFPDSMTSIGYNAFQECSSLTRIYIPSSVVTINASWDNNSPFCGCSSSLVIYTGAASKPSGWGKYWNYYGSSACNTYYGYSRMEASFYGGLTGSETTVVIPDGVTYITENAFYNNSNLISITIPESVTRIESSAFYGCSSLTDITIPNSVTSIGFRVFYGCSGLTSITIPDSITSIGSDAFCGCSSLTSITIPDSVTSIGSDAFRGCSNLTSIYIPSSVVRIQASKFNDSPFYECSKSLKIYTGAESKLSGWGDYWNYYGYGDICLTKYGWALFYSSLTGKEKNIVIPDGVNSIPEEAFRNNRNLTSITIPDSVTSIGSNAFSGCSSLNSITIPDSVTSIGSYAFYNCSGLTSITILYGVTSIGDYAFYNCSSLTSITIPSGVTRIGSYAFYKCSGLTSITIPSGVTRIGSYAFYNCSGLTSITIPSGVTSIGNSAFQNCSGLTSITIPSGVTSIGSYAFSDCSNLSLRLPEHITSIGSSAFNNVKKLICDPLNDTSGTLVNAGYRYYPTEDSGFLLTESNGKVQVYSYNGSRTKVIIPDHINIWNTGYNQYAGNEYTEIKLPSTLCGTDVFTLGANHVTVPDGITSLGSLSVNNCKDIYIPASVTDLSNAALYGINGSKPTVCCYMDSEAELWAIVNDYKIKYLDQGITYAMSYTGSAIRLDIGETCELNEDDFLFVPIPMTDLPVTYSGSAGLSLNGKTVTAAGAGEQILTVYMGGLMWEVPVYVYAPVQSFDLTAPAVMARGRKFVVTVSNAAPAGISGVFTWEQDGVPMYTSGKTDPAQGFGSISYTFTAPAEPGDTVITVTAPNGVSRSVTVHVPENISAPYAGGNNRTALVGDIIDICVDCDGVTCTNDPSLYGGITIPASAASILELTENNTVRVIDTGRTAFSVMGLDGTAVNIVVVANCRHQPVVIPAQAPTCTETGLSEGSYCKLCGEILVPQYEVPAVNPGGSHIEVADEAVPATCSNTGLTAGSHCGICGFVITEQQIVPKIPHTVVVDPAVPAQPGKAALKEGSHCMICGEVLVEQEEYVCESMIPYIVKWVNTPVYENIASIGYIPGPVIGMKTGFTVSVVGGVSPYRCNAVILRNGELYRTIESNAFENSVTFNVQINESVDGDYRVVFLVQDANNYSKATDAKQFLKVVSGRFEWSSGETAAQIPAVGHAYEKHISETATCTEDGLYDCIYCTLCGEIEKTISEVIPASGHVPVDVAGTEPTCTSDGMTDGTYCSVCNEWLIESTTIDAPGHVLMTKTVVPADNTSDGKIEWMICSACGQEIDDTVISRNRILILPVSLSSISKEAFIGISAQQIVIPAGCKTIGKMAFANCGSLKLVIIPASVTSIAANAFDGCGDFVIYCAAGSRAEAYANSNAIMCFVPAEN